MAEGTVHEQVIARAVKDPAFRQALLSNPRAVLAQEYNVHIPEQVAIRVIEDPPDTISLVLPSQPQEGSVQMLSDADLEAVAGGLRSETLHTACNLYYSECV